MRLKSKLRQGVFGLGLVGALIGSVGKTQEVSHVERNYELNRIAVKVKESVDFDIKDLGLGGNIKKSYPHIENTLKRLDEIKERFPVRAKRAPKDINVKDIRLEDWYFIEGNTLELMNNYKFFEGKLFDVVERVPIQKNAFVPNDERYGEQWHHQKIESERAWDVTRGDYNVKIGIVDGDGVEVSIPDLEANTWINFGEFPGVDDDDDGKVSHAELVNHGFNDINGDGDVDLGDLYGSKFEDGIDNDGNGKIDDFMGWHSFQNSTGFHENNDVRSSGPHGTIVAGAAVAVGNNEIGVSGVCPGCTFMTYKDILLDALPYLSDNGADIINMSLVLGGESDLMRDAINYSAALGVVNVASAGNNNSGEPVFPAAYDNVISVGGTEMDDSRANFSNYGEAIDIAAPARRILTTFPDGEYLNVNGTSLGTPLVSGLAGLLFSIKPILTRDEIESILKETSDKFGIDIPATDQPIGVGRVNAGRALESLVKNDYNAIIKEPFEGQEFADEYFDIRGIANGKSYTLSMGVMDKPESWFTYVKGEKDKEGYLGRIELNDQIPGMNRIILTVYGQNDEKTDYVDVRLSKAFMRGDVNGDRFFDISDPVNILFYKFGVGNNNLRCMDAADVNDNGRVELGDVLYLLNFHFANGPTPRSPFPGYGSDPTPDGFGCDFR